MVTSQEQSAQSINPWVVLEDKSGRKVPKGYYRFNSIYLSSVWWIFFYGENIFCLKGRGKDKRNSDSWQNEVPNLDYNDGHVPLGGAS